jgi:hypothetical protein
LKNAQDEAKDNLSETVAAVRRVEEQVRRTRSELQVIKGFPGDLTEIRKELKFINSSLKLSAHASLERRSNLDRADLEIKGETVESYFRRLYSSGGAPSEQDLWELIWDFLQADRVCKGDCKCTWTSSPA